MHLLNLVRGSCLEELKNLPCNPAFPLSIFIVLCPLEMLALEETPVLLLHSGLAVFCLCGSFVWIAQWLRLGVCPFVVFLWHFSLLENGNIWVWLKWHYITLTRGLCVPSYLLGADQFSWRHGTRMCLTSSGTFPTAKPSLVSNHIPPQILQMRMTLSWDNLSNSFLPGWFYSPDLLEKEVSERKSFAFIQF